MIYSNVEDVLAFSELINDSRTRPIKQYNLKVIMPEMIK